MLGQSEDHEEVTQYQDGIFSTSLIMSNEMMSNGINLFLDALEKHDEFQTYYEKIKLMKPKLLRGCMDLYKAYKLNNGKGDIFVLNHGDFHMKNLMFKFNKRKTMEDIIMVDYQISVFAPSNIDIMYSHYMMLSNELRLKRNHFNNYYFEEFLRMLKVLNYQGELPKFSDFQIAGIKYRHFGKQTNGF